MAMNSPISNEDITAASMFSVSFRKIIHVQESVI